ncbi:MAG: hypothetical protein JWQ38_1969 [Flavipsychrobacter sp.]|nr:hypothetical protein [Flavipsychrobacter sp.]
MRIKHLYYLLPLLLCCCNKPQETPAKPDPNANFQYSVKYDPIITVEPNSTANFIFSIEVSSGDISTNRLTCSLTNLPGNASVAPSSMSVGLVQGGLFMIKTGDIPAGLDTLKFTISNAATGTETYRVILKVVPPIDYAALLAGSYDSCSDFCNTGSYKHHCFVSADTAYSIKIRNLSNIGDTFIVKAKVTDKIIIPYQVTSGKKVWGRGTYSHDPKSGNTLYQMVLNDTIVTGTDTQTCIANIRHL